MESLRRLKKSIRRPMPGDRITVGDVVIQVVASGERLSLLIDYPAEVPIRVARGSTTGVESRRMNDN